MVNTITVTDLKHGDYFQFSQGQRIHNVYFIECKEVFYTNILSKCSRKIKLNLNPERKVILLTSMFEKITEELNEKYPF